MKHEFYRKENDMRYEVYETDDYIRVQPVGNIVNARACKTFYKREGWTLENVRAFYEE